MLECVVGLGRSMTSALMLLSVFGNVVAPTEYFTFGVGWIILLARDCFGLVRGPGLLNF